MRCDDCSGSGTIGMNGPHCPKCQGAGQMPDDGREASPEQPEIRVTGGDDDVMAHCTCGWYDTVPAGTPFGHFGWLVSQHADTHRRKP